jgi:peptidoglycan LD-endopeptidase LytH
MKRLGVFKIFSAVLLVLASCNSIKKGLSGNKSPHENYADALKAANLQQTQLGSLWFAAAAAGLQRPVTINLPYKETGYFASDKPASAGFSFQLRRGDLLKVSLNSIPASTSKLFIDLWKPSAKEPELLAVADTLTNNLQYEARENVLLVLRLQPELLKSVEYTVSIITAPSLAFPVQESGKPKIISGWGAGRDNGTRTHEGIDIGAAFGTPVLAVANGYINSVTENNLGGKVIFLRPENKNFSVYYAHLSKQVATTGQHVNEGDIIGMVGNTGNAKNTVPHLHFGIYTGNGAVDPQPFVDRNRASPAEIKAALKKSGEPIRTNSSVKFYTAPSSTATSNTIGAGQALVIQAATSNWYKVELPDQRKGFILSNNVTEQPLRKQVLKDSVRLLDQPAFGAAAKTIIPPGTAVPVLALQDDFFYTSYKDLDGWVNKNN